MPLLVRQAYAAEPIYYSELAAELDMPNPRNLNYVLGSIGQALRQLSERWNEEVPPIQCLVVNKNTGLPGEGIGWFITDTQDFRRLPRRQQRRLVDLELQKVYAYRRWPDVMAVLGVVRATTDYRQHIVKAARFRAAGESEAHRKLKDLVATNPRMLGLPHAISSTLEYPLPSGDKVDVLFQYRGKWIGVEVKPLTLQRQT